MTEFISGGFEENHLKYWEVVKYNVKSMGSRARQEATNFLFPISCVTLDKFSVPFIIPSFAKWEP